MFSRLFAHAGQTFRWPQFVRRRAGRASVLARDFEDTRARLQAVQEELSGVYSLGAAMANLFEVLIGTDSTVQDMAATVLDQARRLTASSLGFVTSIDPSAGDHAIRAVTPLPAQPARSFTRLPRRPDGSFPGLRGHSLNAGLPFFTNSPADHPAFTGYPPGHAPIERFLSAPVVVDGQTVGQISLANSCRDYNERDLSTISRLATFYALAIERKQSQERTSATLREKEILIREIHHRVKNNLQVISSLLSLQNGLLKDPAAIEMLRESQNRVRSMALVHEQLHRSGDLSRIQFREYVRNLTASLVSSYGIDSSSINLRLQVEDACFPIDIAVPCGLIIQELVSNSLKHAFPSGRPGEIFVRLRSTPQDMWRLTIGDNGVGLPEPLDLEHSSSLGLRLVRILAEQIDASVSCTSGAGTRFRVKFRKASCQNE